MVLEKIRILITTEHPYTLMKNTQTKKDKKWITNPAQKKNPKIYSIKAVRKADGSFHILEDECQVCIKTNQHAFAWQPVDGKALTAELTSNKIFCN